MTKRKPLTGGDDNFFVLKNSEIDETLAVNDRQYFVGDLERPQELPFLKSEGLEVGMSWYREHTADIPHWHTQSTECLFIIEGEYNIRIIESGDEFTLRAGDFLALPARTAYASKSRNVKALFIKAPGGPDKRSVDESAEIRTWLNASASPEVPSKPESDETERRATSNPPIDRASVIAMHNIHQSDWEHRDTLLWNASFKIFFAALIVGLLPYLQGYFNVSIPLHPGFFFGASVVLSCYFMLVSLAYGARLSAAGNSLVKMQNLLPTELRRVSLDEIPIGRNRFIKLRIAYWAPTSMFIFLLLVALVVLLTTMGMFTYEVAAALR